MSQTTGSNPPSQTIFRCTACKRVFQTSRSLKLHIHRSPICHKFWIDDINHQLSTPASSAAQLADNENQWDIAMDETGGNNEIEDVTMEIEGPDEGMSARMSFFPPQMVSSVDIPEVEEEKYGARFIEQYHGEAVTSLGKGVTEAGKLHSRIISGAQSPWEPFESQEEFELVEWLMKRANKTAIEEFLHLPIVCLDHANHLQLQL